MNPQEVQAEDFKLYAVGKDGQLTEKTLPETHVLLGQFDNGTGEIFMGISQENFRASINEGEATYMLEPLSDYINDAERGQYIKYNVTDIIDNGENHGCGFDENSFEVQQTETASTSLTSAILTYMLTNLVTILVLPPVGCIGQLCMVGTDMLPIMVTR